MTWSVGSGPRAPQVHRIRPVGPDVSPRAWCGTGPDRFGKHWRYPLEILTGRPRYRVDIVVAVLAATGPKAGGGVRWCVADSYAVPILMSVGSAPCPAKKVIATGIGCFSFVFGVFGAMVEM